MGQVDHRTGEDIFKGLRLRKFWQQGRDSQHGPVGCRFSVSGTNRQRSHPGQHSRKCCNLITKLQLK